MVIDKHQANVNIDWEHHLIHHERLFIGQVNAVLAGSGTLAIHITTPNTNYRTHVSFDIDNDKSGVIVLRESDVLTVGTGTAVPMLNHDRNSNSVYSGTVKKDATVATPGTVLRNLPLSAGHITLDGEKRKGEYILKANATTTLLFTADGAGTNTTLTIDLYEA